MTKNKTIKRLSKIIESILDQCKKNIIYCHHIGCNKWEIDDRGHWDNYEMVWCCECIEIFKCQNHDHIRCDTNLKSFCKEHTAQYLKIVNDFYMCDDCHNSKSH